jgi:type I restriction enzyme S subunit
MTDVDTDIELKIDKSKWKPVRLGDVVEESRATVKDINKERIERIVGLEHIDSESIHLRKWDTIDKGTTFTKYFKKGQVLFGRRRAYLKKAALATFDGVCSGDITVLQAKKELLPELLPFLINSDKFFDYAVKNSAGSLSPRAKFKDLASYEFLLPPKDQQARLAELLWAADDSLERLSKLILSLNQQLSSYIKGVITSSIAKNPKEMIRAKSPFQTKWIDAQYPKGWKCYKLVDVISDYQNGFAEGKRDENGIPQLRMNNVTRSGRIDLSSVEMIPDDRNIDRYRIEENDVLFCNTNSEDLVGKSILANSQIIGFTFSNHFTRLRPKNNLVTPKFLHAWLKYHFDIGLFERRCTKWIGQAAIQTENLLGLYIVLPPLNEQIIANEKIKKIEQAIEFSEIKLERSRMLQKSLINQIF